MKIELKGIPGIIAAVVAAAGVGGWVLYQRSTLHAQGREAAQEYIARELASEAMRARLAGRIGTRDLDAAQEFTITDIRSRRFIPRDPARVRVDVSTPDGPRTFWLRMRRTLGEWRIQRQLPEPLLDW